MNYPNVLTLILLIINHLFEFITNHCKQHIEINLIGRLITEKYYIKLEERVMSLQFQSAQERYNHIIKNAKIKILASH